jgi:hypothetical protein
MPVKKTFASVKTVAKKPTVTVETKKIADDCCSSKGDAGCCVPKKHCAGKVLLVGLLVLNAVLSLTVLLRQGSIESMRVGGSENYKMLRQVFQSEGFQAQQKQQIQQAMQMYQLGGTPAAATEQVAAPAVQ